MKFSSTCGDVVRKGGILLAALGLVVLSAGCSQPADGAQAAEASPKTAALDKTDERALFLAEQTLVSRCMEREGFRYLVIPPGPDDFVERPWGNDDVASARRTGYGLQHDSANANADAQSDGAAVDVNGQYVRGLAPEQQVQFDKALFGSPHAPRTEVALPNGDSISFGTDGCVADARADLYGDGTKYVQQLGFTDNLGTEIQNRVIADDAFIDAQNAWRDCMKEKGRPYENMGEAQAAAAASPRIEITVAVADAQCSRQAKLVATGERLEGVYRNRVYKQYEGRIVGYREMQRTAVGKARRVLATE